MKIEKQTNWKFTDEYGSFEWENPHTLNQLYFPICNEAGFMGSVTTKLHGDATTGQHTFIRLPLTLEDIHNTKSSRNFWIYNDKIGAYSLTGNSARQNSEQFDEDSGVSTKIKGSFLAHTLIREDFNKGIKSEITSFAPVNDDKVEIIRVKITNTSNEVLKFTPTTAMPLYCRSADSLRDHRHWTSLALRIKQHEFGLSVKPEIHHDERGHKPNDTSYFVISFAEDNELPSGQFPTAAEFIGEGGSFDWPQVVVKNLEPYKTPPNRRDGMDLIGAFRFKQTEIKPDQSREYIIIEGAEENDNAAIDFYKKYSSIQAVDQLLEENKKFWQSKIDKITFETADPHFDKWMRWVALQPILRKIYGNSFLLHFDYGRGGRGWRDLWQDSLALLLQNPIEMREVLASSYSGIRLDGSNATIIEKGLGKFSADRNTISRVWMDHGIWPYFTTKMYVDQTGDIDIFFEEKKYWKDHQIKRAKARDQNWEPAQGTWQKKSNGEIYTGSIFEHALVQHLTCFFNVGEHNNIKLEDADWNDLLDSANKRGETVPFSTFYGWNLLSLASLIQKYKEVKQTNALPLFKEILDLTSINMNVDYESPEAKNKCLQDYFQKVHFNFSGEKANVNIDQLAADLIEKGNWLLAHVRNNEWLESKTGYSFFNGYYNNDGNPVDGDHPDSTRMNLTAQTFPIMTGAATDQQVLKAFDAVKAILKDPYTGGYRLTTPLGPNTLNLGRGYAVIYGEKETGGMFNHMVVMFLNGLYRRGFVNEGYEVFTTLYRLVNDTPNAKIYPGIPEYINHEGRGMYTYLSGSASWLLMTVLTQMFGVRGEFGDLVINPKLVKEQFNTDGIAKTNTYFLGKRINVVFHNARLKNFDEYEIKLVNINGNAIEYLKYVKNMVTIQKSVVIELLSNKYNIIDITLD
jgi:cellobiose phosphorylase